MPPTFLASLPWPCNQDSFRVMHARWKQCQTSTRMLIYLGRMYVAVGMQLWWLKYGWNNPEFHKHVNIDILHLFKITSPNRFPVSNFDTDLPSGTPYWHQPSCWLVEIAASPFLHSCEQESAWHTSKENSKRENLYIFLLTHIMILTWLG